MNETTLDKMRKMKLLGMHRAFKADIESGRSDTYTPDEIISYLMDAEWDERQNRSVEQKIKNARFRYKALLEGLHYSPERNLDKNQVMRCADCHFIDKAENLLITGSTGSGKSYVASALGYHACSLGYRVVYHNVPKLFAKLNPDFAVGLAGKT